MQVVTVWMSESKYLISLCLNKRKIQGNTSPQLHVSLFFCAKFAHAAFLLFKTSGRSPVLDNFGNPE